MTFIANVLSEVDLNNTTSTTGTLIQVRGQLHPGIIPY